MHARVDNAARLAPIIAGLVALSIFAWAAMFSLHQADASRMDVMLIWVAMTVGMMTPSALPMIGAYDRIIESLDQSVRPSAAVLAFIAGYLAVWLVFAVVAAETQIVLRDHALIGAHMVLSGSRISGMFLIAAGLYQLTPMKHVCISKCRSPLGFLLANFAPGYRGALLLGVRHGAFCLGCCWLLMLLVWIGGMSNLIWMAAISLIVIAEKTAPHGDLLAKGTGVALVAFGIVCLAVPGSEVWLSDEALASICRGSI